MNNNITFYLTANKSRFIADLKRLVDIKSVREAPLPGKPFGEGPARALAEAEKLAAEHGFSVRNFDNYAGEITFGDAPDLMLLAHLDVVSEGDGWTKEPYRMTEENGRLYGRGTTDDKGPAVACLYALEAARELYGAPKTGVRLVLGCGEETGSEDMEYYFSQRETLQYTLSPDADYPLIHLEKGRFAPEFSQSIAVPGGLLEINGGATANIVPGKANALIAASVPEQRGAILVEVSRRTGASFRVETENGNTRLYCEGVSAHAASPEKGVNANTALLTLLCEILPDGEMKRALSALLAMVPHGETDGAHCGVKMSDEVSGPLTLNFGILQFDGHTLRGGFDLRCPVCAEQADVKGTVARRLAESGFALIGDPIVTPAHYVPKDAPIVKEALRVYEDYTGQKGECLAIGGGTYVHGIEGGVAFGVEFPGTDYRIHGADEFAVTDELLLTAAMYAQIIKDLCY